jgi:hypothetical protein
MVTILLDMSCSPPWKMDALPVQHGWNDAVAVWLDLPLFLNGTLPWTGRK